MKHEENPYSKNHFFEKINFWFLHGYWPNLDNPQSFSEKIIWKKLYDRNPILPIAADKHRVRYYVESKLGKQADEVLIPQIWVGNDPKDIPFDKLTEDCIIKANHGSRMNLIYRMSNKIPKDQVIRKAQKWISRDFGVRRNEWCYSQIPKKIVIEKLLSEQDGNLPDDIKLYMFAGRLGLILISRTQNGRQRRAFFDANFQMLDITKGRKTDPSLKVPDNIDSAIQIAEKLSADFDHIRVDLYSHKGNIYFGELTNYSASGRVPFRPRSFDIELGKKWKLNQNKSLHEKCTTLPVPIRVTEDVPKIAITVQKYHHPGQTFVNRHIKHLFGGNTCVISERHYNEPEKDAPNAFYLSDVLFNTNDVIKMPFKAWNNYKEHHGFRVPYGAHKEKLISFIKAENIQIILSEFGSQSMLVASLGAELGIPVFCYFRGRDASFWLQNETRVQAYKKVFPQLAGVFAVSQYLLDNLAEKGLVHPNSHVVPSGTNIDLFKPDEKDPNLALVVGRFVKKKNPLLNIKAFHTLCHDFPNASLEMIGDGPEMKACEKYIEENNLGDRIILHGKKDSTFIASRINKASIFMQHSVIDDTGEAEGLPSSIQEAMAAGCAINSTDHAGIPEIVTPVINGFLCAENDLENYTENYRKLLSDVELTAQMGKASRKIAEDRIDYRKLYAHVENVMMASLNK